MYKFRLTLSHSSSGFFSLSSLAFGYPINKTIGLELYPRDSDNLREASRYHIDCGGFKTKEEALIAGESLRQRLRILNCILDLGLNIQSEDKATGYISDSLKQKAEETGSCLLDSRQGLSVIPDDGLHFEFVTSGHFKVAPSDPMFLFDAVKDIWDKDT